MKNKTKLIVKFAAVLLPVLLMAQSCNLLGNRGGGGKQIELAWWKPFEDARYVQPLIEAFEAVHQNIRIRFVSKDIETYEDELVDALASGTGPDIFSLHNDWLPKHKGKITPAPAKILSLREFKESFLPVVASDFLQDEQIYALPLAVDVLSLYYNKDILSSAGIARPPNTWVDLVDMTPRLTRQDSFGNFERSAVALGTAGNINRAPDIMGLLMLQNNTPFYTPDRGQALIHSNIRDQTGKDFSPGERALEFYTQFANPAKLTYTWNNRNNNSIDAFASGQVAMIFGYSYLRPALAAKAPFLNYGIAGVPQIDGTGARINFANYWGEAVSKQTKEIDAAWQFLKFITDKEIIAKYYEVQKQPSSRIDILEEQISDPEIGAFAENALSTKSFYKPNSDSVENIFVQMIEDVILRSISVEEALGAASQKLNLLLRRF